MFAGKRFSSPFFTIIPLAGMDGTLPVQGLAARRRMSYPPNIQPGSPTSEDSIFTSDPFSPTVLPGGPSPQLETIHLSEIDRDLESLLGGVPHKNALVSNDIIHRIRQTILAGTERLEAQYRQEYTERRRLDAKVKRMQEIIDLSAVKLTHATSRIEHLQATLSAARIQADRDDGSPTLRRRSPGHAGQAHSISPCPVSIMGLQNELLKSQREIQMLKDDAIFSAARDEDQRIKISELQGIIAVLRNGDRQNSDDDMLLEGTDGLTTASSERYDAVVLEQDT